MTRLLSLSPLTVLPCSPVEQIEAAARAGFDAVGLRLVPTMGTDVDVMADSTMKSQIERRLRDTGMRVLDVEVVRLRRDLDTVALEPVLEFAGTVGAGWLATTSGSQGEHGPDDEPAVVDRLAELCQSAAQYQLGVMVEFMQFRGIRNLTDAARVVSAAAQPNCAINLDLLHFHRSGGVAADLAAMDAELLACVQLCDAPAVPPPDLAREARHERLLPGSGALPLAEYLAALPTDLPVSVEVPSSQWTHASVDARAQQAAEAARRFLEAIPA